MPDLVYLLQFGTDNGFAQYWSVLEVTTDADRAALWHTHGFTPVTAAMQRRVQIARLNEVGDIHDWIPNS